MQELSIDKLVLLPHSEDDSKINLDGQLTVEVVNPLGHAVPIDVLELQMASDFTFLESGQFRRIGTVNIPRAEVWNSTGFKNASTDFFVIQFTFPLTGTLEMTDPEGLGQFLSQYLAGRKSTASFKGTSGVKIFGEFGTLMLTNIPLNAPMKVPPLTEWDVKINKMDFGGGYKTAGLVESGDGMNLNLEALETMIRLDNESQIYMARNRRSYVKVDVEATVINLSPFAMQIDCLPISLYYGETCLGHFVTKSPILLAANGQSTIFDFTGVLKPQNSPSDFRNLSKLLSAFLGNPPTSSPGEGDSDAITIKSESHLSQGPVWLKQGLSSLKFVIPLKSLGNSLNLEGVSAEGLALGSSAINVLEALTLQSFVIDFRHDCNSSPHAAMQPMGDAGNVCPNPPSNSHFDIGLPLGFSAEVRMVNPLGKNANIWVEAISMLLQLNVPSSVGLLGSFAVPTTQIDQKKYEFVDNGGETSKFYVDASGYLWITDRNLLSQFTHDVLERSSVDLKISGNCSSSLDTPLGPIHLLNYPISRSLHFDVPNIFSESGIANDKFTITKFEVSSVTPTKVGSSGTANAYQLDFILEGLYRNDESQGTIYLGNVVFDILGSFPQLVLGNLSAMDLSLLPGESPLNAVGYLSYDNKTKDVLKTMVENILSSQENKLQLSFAQNQPHRPDWLVDALRPVKFNISLKGCVV